MFTAYPQQQSRRSRWKLVLPLCVACVVCMVMYSSLDVGSQGRASPSDGQADGVHFLQPFIKTQGVDVGLWTRSQPAQGSDAAPPGSSSGGGETRGASSSHTGALVGHSEIQRLQKELEAERARSAAQTLELARLRGGTASQATTLTSSVSTGASSAQAAALDDASDVNEQSTAVPSKEDGAAVAIPDSLWRNPPDDAETVSDESMVTTTVATTTIPTTTVAPTTLPTSLASTTAPVKAASDDQGDHRITIKSGNSEIVVSMGRPSKDDATTSMPAPPPTLQSTTTSGNADEHTTTLQSGPITTPQITTTSAAPTPVPQVEDRSNQIRIQTGGSEIIVNVGDKKPQPSTTIERTDPPTSTTTESLVTSTQAAVAPVGGSDSGVLPSSIISTSVADDVSLTSSYVETGATAVTTTTELEKKIEALPLQEAASKQSQGTKITVMSGNGQSITIEVGGTKSKSDDVPTTSPLLTTATTSTLTTDTTSSLPTTSTSTDLSTLIVQTSTPRRSTSAASTFQPSEPNSVSSQTKDLPQARVPTEPVVAAESQPPSVPLLPSQESRTEDKLAASQASSSGSSSSSRVEVEYANLALRAR